MRWLFLLMALIAPASAQQIGVMSFSPTGGFDLNGPNTAGRSYYPAVSTAPTGAAVGAANRLFAVPLFVGAGSVLKSLSFNITAGNASAWNARMCVYADNGAGLPGSLVANGDTGTIAIGSGSVTGVQTATLNGATGITVSGWIWLGFMADNASESVTSIAGAVSTVGALMTNLLGANSAAAVYGSTGVSGVFVAQTFGACPGTFGTASYGSGANTPWLVANF